jgi:hypothetical protein
MVDECFRHAPYHSHYGYFSQERLGNGVHGKTYVQRLGEFRLMSLP